MGQVENFVGKGEHTGHEYFLFPQCFQNVSFPGSFKDGIMW